MTDKIVILAGGISSRMKRANGAEGLDNDLIKDADEKQKAMIGLGENHRPFLDYLLQNISDAGIKEVLIVIGENDESIKNYYVPNKKNSTFNRLNIQYAVQKLVEGRVKPAGTADALYQGLLTVPEWRGSTFLVCNSDNLYSVKAMRILMESHCANAIIDYDRDGLLFDTERISGFAITRKDAGGFLHDIVEKPSEQAIEAARIQDGYVGVSMNLFRFSYDIIFQCLEETPYHPIRNEKELPTALKIMIDKYPGSVCIYKLSEHVPDLTSKEDIIPVREYLKKEYSNRVT